MKNKLHILKNKPRVSEKEIKETMDFEQLLKASRRKQPEFPRGYFSVFRWGLGILLLAAGLFWVYSSVEPKQEATTNYKAEITSSPKSPKKHTTQQLDSYAREEPVLSSSGLGTEDGLSVKPQAVSTEVRKNQKPTKNPKPVVQKEISKLQQPIANSQKAIPEQYSFIEAKPKIGLKEMYAFLNSELVYPTQHLEEQIEGEVLVNFTIDKSGRIVKVHIEKSLGSAFDQEAIRVIRSMPPWHPATVNGTAIDSKLAIPLYFNIEQ